MGWKISPVDLQDKGDLAGAETSISAVASRCAASCSAKTTPTSADTLLNLASLQYRSRRNQGGARERA